MIEPPTIRPGDETSRITDMAITLLPHPLSPTSPSVLPRGIVSDTSSTALTTPSSVKKCVCRFLISTSGWDIVELGSLFASFAQSRIGGFLQPFADQVVGEHG